MLEGAGIEGRFEGRRGIKMLLLNLMLVTVFLVLLAVSVGEVYDATHATQRAPRRDPK